MTKRTLAITAAIVLLAGSAYAQGAPDTQGSAERLLIVNANTGRVIFDDGRNDLFCVTRTVTVGHTESGRPIRKRTMRCR